MNRIKINLKSNTITQNYLHKSRFKSLGINIRFGGTGSFYNSENITIDDNVYIGRQFYMDAISEIIIKSGTMIGPKVTIIAGTHNYNSDDLQAIPYDKRIIDTPVIIENNVWIGANVTICPGTVIGEGAVIGMGTTIAGKIPAYSVVVSAKPNIIKYRDVDKYCKLKENNFIYNCKMVSGDFSIVSKS